MNKLITMAGVAFAAMAIYSCDEDTATIGGSLTNDTDRINLTSANYEATTRTVIADSVYTLSNTCYFGCVRDPETGTEVKSEFTSQFHILEYTNLPALDEYVRTENGLPIADSCDIVIYLQSPFNDRDTLAAMKMRVNELGKPVEAGQRYYSNYDPFEKGLVRTDPKAYHIDKMFTYKSQTDSDSLKGTSGYFNNIRISLNKPYTDVQGNTYNNYGTYILHAYYTHPEYFANSYSFAHHVCPGFFFQILDGLGFHARVYSIGLRTYFTVTTEKENDEGDTIVTESASSFTIAGTQEVIQTTFVSNNSKTIKELAQENQHTYIKSPAGLFTEVTLPIDNIKQGHERDSLLSSKIIFQRINNQSTDDRVLGTPSTLLMIPADSLYTFFENNKVPDNVMSYYTTFNSSYNTYTFNNISNLVTALWNIKQREIKQNANWTAEHPNWNKVVLVPISYTNNTATGGINSVEHYMGLASTRLVGGSNNPNQPINISVVYGKFND